MNKPGNPQIFEMGGLAIVFGFYIGAFSAIGLKSFLHVMRAIDSTSILAALAAIFLVYQIGTHDDLFGISQLVKAIAPLLASIPLLSFLDLVERKL